MLSSVYSIRINIIVLSSPEPIDPGRVLDGDGLPIRVDVAVLSDPLVVAAALLFEGDPVLLCECGPELAVPHVEALLLQDARQARVAVELRCCQSPGCHGRLPNNNICLILC